MYTSRISNHGVQAALLLVIEYYGSPKSSTLCVPDLLLEAAHAPGDQNEPRISSATVAEGRPIIPETRASVKGFRNVQRAADPESIDRNSEACRGVEEGEGEGLGAQVDEGVGGSEEG